MKKKITAAGMAIIIAVSLIMPVFATQAEPEGITQQTEDAQTAGDSPVTDSPVQNNINTINTINTVKTGYVPQSLSSPPEIVAEAAIVVDINTGYTLYEKNIQAQHYPASITKIMTAILALENLKMEDVVTFSHDAVFSIEPGSSSAYADEGEQLTVEQCLYGLMLISGNDLANGLAEAVSGSMDAFAAKMTDKARELGCVGTQFKNAHGLHDEGHYTTAYDMAVIGIYAFQNFQQFRDICSTIRYNVPPTNIMPETRYWLNNNRMIREGEEYYYSACMGGKTGFTNEAGGTLVTFANIAERPMMCVVLKSTNSASAYADTIALYDYISANATAENYSLLDQKAEEDRAMQEALHETKNPENTSAVSNIQPVTKKKKEQQQEKKTNHFAVVQAGIVVAIVAAVFYFYVSYRRFQAEQRKRMRRQRQRRRMSEQEMRNRKIEERRRKYRNYEFTDKK